MAASETTQTKDIPEDRWSTSERLREELLPRLRLLYHRDPARIGALSLPGAVRPEGDWLTLGRGDPAFLGVGLTATAAPIEDPYISREQLRLRWLSAEQRFEIEPSPSARRPVGEVDLRPSALGARDILPITGRVLLA